MVAGHSDHTDDGSLIENRPFAGRDLASLKEGEMIHPKSQIAPLSSSGLNAHRDDLYDYSIQYSTLCFSQTLT
jgi:hypothetical protein